MRSCLFALSFQVCYNEFREGLIIMNKLSTIFLVIIIILVIALGIVSYEFYYQNTRTAETGVYICRMLNAIDEAGFELQLTNEALEYYSHNPGIPNGPYVLVNKTGPAE